MRHRHHIIATGLLAACAAAPVRAEWQPVVTGANSTAYADAATIRRVDAMATMQVLIDYRKPPFDGNNLPYLSLTMRNEYRCTDAAGGAPQYRVLAIASHADHMGRGARPFVTDEAGEWETVSPHTVQQDLWKLACAADASKKDTPQPGAPQKKATPQQEPAAP